MTVKEASPRSLTRPFNIEDHAIGVSKLEIGPHYAMATGKPKMPKGLKEK